MKKANGLHWSNWCGRGKEPIPFRLERWLEDVFPEPLHGLVTFFAFPLFVVTMLLDSFNPSTEPRMPLEQLIWDAVAKRFTETHPDFTPRGPRQRPTALGWRFVQRLELKGKAKLLGENMVEKIEAGQYDAEIEATFEDAAEADGYYLTEKNWE